MAIIIDSTLNLDQVGHRIRILSGISIAEIADATLSEIISMAIEWFEEETALSYTVNTENAYDNAVVFYSCYLSTIAQNGIGLESLKIGDIFVKYQDEEPYNKFLLMAKDALRTKIASSIKTTTYNASSSLGDVDWKKNIDGSSGTQNVRQKPRGM
jgi:hypothetical protein